MLRPADGPLEGQGVWRYANGVAPPAHRAGLARRAHHPAGLGRDRGRDHVRRLEAAQPTGSFKDCAATTLAAWLSRSRPPRCRGLVGKRGRGPAAYGARARISATSTSRPPASPGKSTQIAAYGARVIPIDGPRQAATDAAAGAVATGVVYATHLWNPRAVGTATWAFEVVEQLGRAPDAVVFPVGAGTLSLGAARAFERLHQSGRIDRVPRIYGGQSTGCPPLALAFEQGLPTPAPVTQVPSAAEGIMLARPPRGAEILRRVRDSGGAILAIDDAGLWAALRGLAHQGIYVEPTSAVAPAVVAQLLGPAAPSSRASRSSSRSPAAASRPATGFARACSRHDVSAAATEREAFRLLKRLLIGKPIATSEEQHQRLRKRIALPIFASDAISSTAYATDEILIVLLSQAGIGIAAWGKLPPLAIVVALLLVIVVLSYRQTIHAYPSGGGAYIVSRENLGEMPSLVAGASLLTDYILTVAVSVAGGVLAIQSAFDFDSQWRVPLVPADDHGHDARQPARAARVGRSVRPTDLPLHRDVDAADRGRVLPRLRPDLGPIPTRVPVGRSTRARRPARRH